jgi:hypothetical protein
MGIFGKVGDIVFSSSGSKADYMRIVKKKKKKKPYRRITEECIRSWELSFHLCPRFIFLLGNRELSGLPLNSDGA